MFTCPAKHVQWADGTKPSVLFKHIHGWYALLHILRDGIILIFKKQTSVLLYWMVTILAARRST